MWSLKANKGLVVKSLLIIVVIGLASFGLYFEFVKKSSDQAKPLAVNAASKPSSSSGAAPALVEKTVDTPTKDALSKSDFAEYQNLKRTIALQYYYNSDTTNAERIMNDVFKNVPKSKTVSATYLTMASIQQSKHDTAEQKKYLQLAIEKLNSEGNPQQAANEQKVLDSL